MEPCVRETERSGEWWERNVLPWHHILDGGGTAKKDVMEEDTATIAASSMENNVVHSENSMTTTISQAVKDTTELGLGSVLLADPRVHPVVIMNGFYMLALSGTQFTLLPLILNGGGGAQRRWG